MSISAPPIDLSQNIAHETILHALNVPVKSHLPATTVCPVCNAEQLRIYHIPVSGGRWFSCLACNFSGDAIELYQKSNNIPNTQDAVTELINKRIIPLERSDVSIDAINNYVNNFINHRAIYRGAVDLARQNMATLTKEKSELLYGLRLWTGFSGGRWYDRLKGYVGIGDKQLFSNLGLSVPKKRFSTFLVCPYYDLPSRVSSLLLINKSGDSIRLYAGKRGAQEQEDGLMMLDMLPARNEVVYAVEDPMFALHLQHRQFNLTESKPIPLVVYSVNTAKTWQSINANRVIFWDKEAGHTLFNQSKLHPKAYIAPEPVHTDQLRFMKSTPISVIISQMRNSAVPWATSIKNFILNGEFWKVSDFLLNLGLSTNDIQRIYDACTPGEKHVVQQLLGDAVSHQHCQIGNMQIIEQDDCWWIIRNADRELACNAIIRILRAVHVADTGQNYYEGVVIVKGKQIEFSAPIDTVEKNPHAWLRQLMMSSIGALITSRSVNKHLLEIAKQFHTPQYVRRTSKVGWNADNSSFIFPNFSIKDGVIDSEARAQVINATSSPAAKITVQSLNMGDWDLLEQNTPENAAIWAGLACFMGNLLSPLSGVPSQPIAFVGGVGSVGNIVSKHLAAELDAPVLTPRRNKLICDEIDLATQEHNYPIWVDLSARNRNALNNLRANRLNNCMIYLTELEAAALGVGESWVFINAPTTISQQVRLPGVAGAISYLAWLQRNGMQLPGATSWQQCILLSLKDWAVDEFKILDAAVFDRASNMLRTFENDSVHQRLIYLIFWLLRSQYCKSTQLKFYERFKQGTEPVNKRHILHDDSENKTFINIENLQHTIGTLKLPVIDQDAAIKSFIAAQSTTDFETSMKGFIISKSYWDKEYKRWQRLSYN